ncbi:glycosyl hydrolase 2 galactose-binding domain-containing protein [Paenibacillus qinlingensis]|uniref:beta-mannosidase n=1 Tax=Paenibacillus qinlingensis TaxID=1837343 RepID=A0ABU1NSA3_9BACL|nr:exo-alpha-sialidase [Paenibacillus qinlingensis]MDR6550318.1 beta-mannosidase [Paenibacillus qinlingensis]
MERSMLLDGTWWLEGVDPTGKSTSIGIEATVPGHVHHDLHNAGIILDPRYRMQADDCQWIEHWEWTYRREFHLEKVKEGYPVLELNGLDTFADIYLNDRLLLQADNMFRCYRIDTAGLLREGVNTLEIKFHTIAEGVKNKPFASYNAAFTNERVYVRRMQCTFGWDWVNRFVSYGIWRSVRLVFEETASIDDVFVYTKAIDPRGAALEYCLKTSRRISDQVWVEVMIVNAVGLVVWKNNKKLIGHDLSLSIDLPEPELWWPAGYGGQPLYTAITILRTESGHVLDECKNEFGIRTVRIEQLQDQPGSAEAALTMKLRTENPQWDANGDQPGSSFTLLVNGVSVYCKGANWVPCDPFPSRVADSHYEHLIRLAKEGNITMLRCWGGGIYEPESFWRWCNRLGILVCQDFLMACAVYPEDDQDWGSNLYEEIAQTIRSLRGHPSLVWWNGDNENGMYQNEDDPVYPGRKIAEQITGKLCKEWDPSRPFLPTSPFGGYPNISFTVGTAHYTGTMLEMFDYFRSHDMRDYRKYFGSLLSRFCPEFPMFGTPEVHSLLTYMSKEDLDDPSYEMLEYHTKNHPALTDFSLFRALLTLTDKLMPPSVTTIEHVRKMSYTQHELTRLVIEAYRRTRFYTSGLLFWMYNDCWPASGWSLVDYYGYPKAGYYAMKKAGKPLIASIDHDEEKGIFTFWICSDLTDQVTGNGTISVISLHESATSSERWSQKIGFTVLAGSSMVAASVPDTELLPLLDTNHVLVMEISTPFGSDRSDWFNGIPAEMNLQPSNVRMELFMNGPAGGAVRISARRGTVIAYYEARMGEGDWTKQDVIMRRSTDNGETWSDRIMLVEGTSTETYHNSSMIASRTGDTVYLFWHRNYANCFYIQSEDEGITWSDPVEITYVFKMFRNEYDWNVIGNGTGHSIQMRSGRLVIPVWLSNGGELHRPSVVSSIYSDDGGTTWERGSIVWNTNGWINPSEATVVELDDGSVMMNFRHESAERRRGVVISKDGGATWGEPYWDNQLHDPICEGSLLRIAYPETSGFSGILFSNCAFDGADNIQEHTFQTGVKFLWGSQSRRNLTIRLSVDEGKSWRYSRLLETYSGYSDLAVSSDGQTIFCLFERDWVDNQCAFTKYLSLATFNLAWLSNGEIS